LKQLEPERGAATIPQAQLEHILDPKAARFIKEPCILINERFYFIEDETLVCQLPLVANIMLKPEDKIA
jgi:hypothetical protein